MGLFLEGVYCLVVFQTYFNPNNSLLIILQISLLFGFTPALTLFLGGVLNVSVRKRERAARAVLKF